ncbi:MAG: EamA family transporter [Firmicutes bacterium]|jgi:drug/metabolite transporter (DMT)-like permease|nr:EamA family transporter [Bacillota bacterium]MBR6351348.1 EamA family transporter [Bacillota bacterium]
MIPVIDEKARTRGTLLTILSGIIFSTGGLFVKLIPWNAMAVNGARHMISFCIVLPYLLLTHHRIRFNARVLLCSLAQTLTHIIFTFATQLTTAGNAIVLEYTSPIWVILISLFILKKKPDKLDIRACVLIFAGIVFFFIDSLSGGNALGNLLGLIAGICYASFYVLGTRSDSDAFSSLLVTNFICGLVGLPWLVRTDIAGAPSSTLIAVLCFGVFQVALANILLAAGFKTVNPVTASLLTALEPVLNPILVAVVYKEMLTPVSIIGVVIVLGAIVYYNYMKAKQVQREAFTNI